jgi:hypothetical protein
VRPRRGLLAPALAAVVALAAGCGSGGGSDVARGPVDRVLVVTLPSVGWADVQGADLPHLDRFLEGAAIGDLSTRIGRNDAGTTDAYLTLGAGTRAVAPVLDKAVAVDPDESYGGTPTAEILERRLGLVPSGIAYLAMGAAIDANDRSAYGAEVGTLGDELAAAGVDRAVIANADAAEGFVSDDPPPDGAYARGAATALIDADGMVPGGTVGRDLLTDDPAAPFGVRLDGDKVVEAFDAAWGDPPHRSVVLVEASDLSRAAAYLPRATGAQRAALRTETLEEADELLGRLLEHVDPERDAVMVLSPVSSPSSPGLGIAAVAAPGIDPALLRSATTRRDGYVQLADVAPTVLSLLGEDAPDTIEGRTFQVVGSAGGDRIERLADASEAADFRDALLPVLVSVIIVTLVLLALATSLRRRIGPTGRRLLVPLALGVLGVVPATFLVGRIEAVRPDMASYAAGVVVLAAVVAAVAVVAERRWPGSGAIVAVGAIVGLVAIDLIVGAPLQVNTAFGYSVAVAGRFVGLGNLAFALFGSAAIVLAALVVDRAGGGALRFALALLGIVVLLEGLPMLGADVGGVVSMVPAFGVTALLLAGRRVGWREVVALAVATAATLLAFAFIDVTRPDEVHTHLARFAEQVVDGRWSSIFKSIGRRWQASLGGAELAGWITVAALMVAAGVYAALVATGRAGPRAPARERHRPTVAAAAGLAVLGTIGLVANDSSVAVPMTMLIVVVPVLVVRTVEGELR